MIENEQGLVDGQMNKLFVDIDAEGHDKNAKLSL